MNGFPSPTNIAFLSNKLLILDKKVCFLSSTMHKMDKIGSFYSSESNLDEIFFLGVMPSSFSISA